jgi:coenzyme F420-reducing hydrogenase delta subunit
MMLNRENRNKLVEFEHGSSTSLAQIEDACSIMLDQYEEEKAAMLEEFERSLEMVLLDETGEQEPSEPDEDAEETPEEEPAEESEEPESEDELIEREEPFEPEKEPEITPEPLPEPENPVIGFVCRHALDVSSIADADGIMNSLPFVRLITLPCAGMIKPEWVKKVLDAGMSGVFVVMCREASCEHRTGARLTAERISGRRRPMIAGKFDTKRLRVWESHRIDQDVFLRRLAKFVEELGALDSEGQQTAD